MAPSGRRTVPSSRLVARILAVAVLLAGAFGGPGTDATAGEATTRKARRWVRKGGVVVTRPADPPAGDPYDPLPWWEDPLLNSGRTVPIDAGGFVICDAGMSFENVSDLGLGDLVETNGWFVLDPTADLPVSEELMRWLVTALPGACVEPDWWIRPPEGSQSNRIVVGSELGRSYPTQTALRRIAAEPAHRIATGRDVVVAVLDTGVDATHPALAARTLPGTDLVDGDDDPSESADGIDSDFDGEADESFGHGTLVAGLVRLVAPDAWILPVRVLDSDGQGAASNVAAGIRWAREHGAQVVNLSLGMRGRSEIVEQEIRLAIEAGVVVVAASGNEGRRISDFPASVQGVVSVTAVGVHGRRARFANRPGKTSVAAPGRNLIGPYPGGTWGQATGTSFSTALVSGAAALVREHEPSLDGAGAAERVTHGARLRLTQILR